MNAKQVMITQSVRAFKPIAFVRQGGGKVVAAIEVAEVFADFFADAHGAVVHPESRDAETRDTGGGKGGIGVDEVDLFFESQARKQVGDTGFDGFGGIEVERRGVGTDGGGEQREEEEAEFQYGFHFGSGIVGQRVMGVEG